MNVLQAVEELQILKDKVSALEVAIFQLDSRNKEHNYEVRMLTEIRDELSKKQKDLQHKLEITPLITTRSTEIK